ncbi:MAG: SDR family NAD(P)-dependent oxidoreductase [Pseudomonadota bacterium]|uniref:SDR family NAD(P)-dependent oxidoreductase n=1 Tax=Salinicola salarius TaxID=430457 RepID=UPI0023E47180|nr:SDR family NAD(P)-dependent oxidoreductase [Salinicola salarius]MDF3918190.1 SDR family NAD(P)-dependent oxidoreductase [Salinicola salarius]MEC8916333.1 SDR family NAD(P)-dependent oxidoreductase [Pseudomonadota bacterium]
MQLAERTFIVTGGGSGLGAATARMLVDAGANVALVDRDLNTARHRARTLGDTALAIQADVTQEADGERALAETLERFGALHGLINCAGVAPAEKIHGKRGVHGLDSFRRTIDINLIGTFNMLRLAVAAMQKNLAEDDTLPREDDGERGVVINTASVAAFEGQIGQAAYAASKAGVVGMTLPAARELASSGIRVMAIAPGIFDTTMMQGMPAEVRDGLNAKVPFPRRMGHAEEYAALVRQILENRYLNGEVIRLDGGIRMSAQ